MNAGLAHERIHAPSATPGRWVLFLHGILGRGLNWRGFARRLTAARPALGALLVDLRAHGGSRELAPPDSLAACAADLERLADAFDHPIEVVVGHSFGGKVATAFAAEHAPVRTLFVVDAYPGVRPDARGSEIVLRVLDMLDALPARFVDRPAFLAHVREAGFGEGLARWLGQSLDPLDEGYEFGLDIDRIRALLDDYLRRDLMPVIDPPRPGLAAHLVIGGASDVYDAEARTEARELAGRHEGVRVHLLEGAGHWVHVDASDALETIVLEGLS